MAIGGGISSGHQGRRWYPSWGTGDPWGTVRNRISLSSTHIKPISYLKSHAAQIVTELTQSREPMVITQNGAATLVVMDVKSYQEHEDTLALLKVLAIGQHDIEQGRFWNAEDVFASIEQLDSP